MHRSSRKVVPMNTGIFTTTIMVMITAIITTTVTIATSTDQRLR